MRYCPSKQVYKRGESDKEKKAGYVYQIACYLKKNYVACLSPRVMFEICLKRDTVIKKRKWTSM